ncbi:MAG: hypothetical protein KGV56_03405 [Gammaproteobacteria bacterium]|nr:hypothetical protein [Gammaproteobacteria bacterium]
MDYNKFLKSKLVAGLKMEAKLNGIASPEDAGKAIKLSYTIASIGLMLMLTGFGICAVLIGYSFIKG